jgi:Fe-S cluster assembly protein SufD
VRIVTAQHRSQLVDTLGVELAAHARYRQHSFAFSGAHLRSTQRIRLRGEGAEVAIAGAAVAFAGAHVDQRTQIEHEADATSSELDMNLIAQQRGKATLSVEAHVPSGRRGVQARQLLRSLPLGVQADVCLRPRLSILSDDVMCRHGATTAALREDELHYLRSRGMTRAQATQLLAEGFLRQRLPAHEGAVGALVDQAIGQALQRCFEVADEAR